MKKIALISFVIVSLFYGCITPISKIEKAMLTKDTVFTPDSVCSKLIEISVVNDTIQKVTFTGGCAGNTMGVAKLLEGMQIDSAISRLDGIICGEKNTSCPDQLAKALKQMKE